MDGQSKFDKKDSSYKEYHTNPKGVIMSVGTSNYANLYNLPNDNSKLTISQVNIDTTKLTKPVVAIQFNGSIHVTIADGEQVNILFILDRKDASGNVIQLASFPYQYAFYTPVVTSSESEVQSTGAIIDKIDPLIFNYWDIQPHGGMYNYSLSVSVSYNSTEDTEVLTGFITAIAQRSL